MKPQPKAATATNPLWLWPNLLSLDAPAVAVLWQGFAAACFHIPLRWPARAALALAVWAVYIADRLLDTAGATNATDTARHQFHRDHRRLMTLCLALALIAAAALAIFHVRHDLVPYGLLTAAAVLLYLGAVNRPELLSQITKAAHPSKEAIASVLFTAGTLLAPWLIADSRQLVVLAATALLPVVWANISLIDALEWTHLRHANTPPPHRTTLALAAHPGQALACYLPALLLLLPVRDLQMFLIAPAVAALGLFLLARTRHRLTPAAFRVLADAALLTPILVWPVILT